MENEISQNGTASEFWNELNGPKQTVSLDEFIRWVFTETRGQSVLERFETMFT